MALNLIVRLVEARSLVEWLLWPMAVTQHHVEQHVADGTPGPLEGAAAMDRKELPLTTIPNTPTGQDEVIDDSLGLTEVS